MSLNKGSRIFSTVSFRLSLWYTLVFALVTLVVFFSMYNAFLKNVKQDISDELAGDTKEFSELYIQMGRAALNREINREAQSTGTKKEMFLLISPGHDILAHSDLNAWPNVDAQIFLQMASNGNDRTGTIQFGIRQAMVRVHTMPDRNVLVVGYALDQLGNLAARYRNILDLWMLVMLVIGVALGWFITRRAMAGVIQVTRIASRIGSNELYTRVPPGGQGLEVRQLAGAFNGMLQRVQVAMEELKRVTDDVAHDLRSPLTRMRLMAESAATTNSGDCKDTAASIVGEIDNMVAMINTMLDISQTESGVKGLNIKSVDMDEIVRAAFDLFEPVAQDKGIEMVFVSAQKPVSLQGDRSRLQRVVANLLDNAIKFTPGPGKVTVSLENTDNRVRLTVRDTGIGIAARDLLHIFGRFYRGERSRTTRGNGLGLSLAAAIIKAHKGSIQVFSEPGKGSEFVVDLPKGA